MKNIEEKLIPAVDAQLLRENEQLRADLAAAREDVARMDYLEREPEIELEWQKNWNGEDRTPLYPDVLYRRNLPITRKSIDAARAGGGK